MFLGRGSHLPQAGRREVDAGGLYGWNAQESHLSGRLHGPHGPRRSAGGDLRSLGDQLSRDSGSLLGQSQPDDAEQAGSGRGGAVPLGDFLSLAGAGGRGSGVEGRGAKPLFKADCDGNRARGGVLARGGVSSAVPGKTRPFAVPYLVLEALPLAGCLPARSSARRPSTKLPVLRQGSIPLSAGRALGLLAIH